MITPTVEETLALLAGRVRHLESLEPAVGPAGPPGAPGAAGSPLDEDYYGQNLVRNSPGQIVTDGNEPQWWDDVANATITDEDTAGEGIADKHERCFKVVTTANNVYGYQTLLFADEELLDAGQTVISFGCWVYCASANKASIGIYGTNLGLQESAQHTGGATWEWLTVTGITLNGADASIDIRLIVDTGTAYFTMPMLAVNGNVLPWKPRGTRYKPLLRVLQFDLNTTGDVAWSDTDCTANTDPLAVGIEVFIACLHDDSRSYLAIGHSDTVLGGDDIEVIAYTQLNNVNAWGNGRVQCDDSQVIRYKVEEFDGDNDVRSRLWLTGYWMWE